MKKFGIMVFVLALATACTPPYQSGIKSNSGYYDYPGPGQMRKIVYLGSSRMEDTMVKFYALKRCAEYAQEKKKPYFILYENLFSAVRGSESNMPKLGYIGSHPIASAFILLLDEEKDGALKTNDVLEKVKLVTP